MANELTVGSLFSGIGGLDLGLERAGMRVVWQCEIDPFCRAVLAHHWPGLPLYGDIREIGTDVERPDVICGGFPCQPVSLAGQGLAQEDPRWLWPEFDRVVGLLLPSYVLVENVPGLATRGLCDVVASLAALGYDAEWDIVSASSVGAPHLRERLFVVAYLDGARQSYSQGGERSPQQEGRKVFKPGLARPGLSEWAPEPNVGIVVDGLPSALAQLHALGNAVVPQVAEFVGGLIVNDNAS